MDVFILLLRETHAERAACALLAFHGKLPALFSAEFANDGKPQTESSVFSAVRFIYCKKSIEDASEIFLGDSDPRIGDAEFLACQQHRNTPAFTIIANGIPDNVAEDLSDTFLTAIQDDAVFDLGKENQPMFPISGESAVSVSRRICDASTS